MSKKQLDDESNKSKAFPVSIVLNQPGLFCLSQISVKLSISSWISLRQWFFKWAVEREDFKEGSAYFDFSAGPADFVFESVISWEIGLQF